MRFILILSFIFLTSCSTVEVTKEVIKAGSSIKTSVTGLISEKDQKPETTIEETQSSKLEEEKEAISLEKKVNKTIVKKQQKTAQVNFIGNQVLKIEEMLGKPQLARVDGNTYILRYDSEGCRLFLFFNYKLKDKKVKYFEMRNAQGNLIESKNSIEQCYREFKLI